MSLCVRRGLPLVWVVVLAGCLDGLPPDAEPEALFGDCEAHQAIEAGLDDALGDAGPQRFDTIRLDPSELRAAFLKGDAVELPIITLNGSRSTVSVVPAAWPLFDDVPTAQRKDRTGSRIDDVQVPTDIHFQVGCKKADEPCGAFTFLDADADEPVRLEGMIIDPIEGWTIYESIPSLWENLGLGLDRVPDDKCGVLYNSAFHGAIDFEDQPDEGKPLGGGTVEGASWLIPIVLDADETYYNLNPETAWTRQRSTLANVNLIYHVIEPLSSGTFDVLFALKAQEAWTTPGTGPNEVDRYELLDRINSPNYVMITHPENNEVSFFFAGYDLIGGIAGVAGGICNVEGYDDTFGSAEDHQKNHAWGQQVTDVDGGYAFSTFYGRVVVMAHEIAHMLGATHGDGSASACAGGGMPSLCGSSLMKSGASGGVAPDFRQAFFTDANDANIIACVGDAAP